MTWDGKERRNNDHAQRIASLEAYSRVQATSIKELRGDRRVIHDGVEFIRREIHGAKVAGRFGFGIAMVLGGFVAWITQTILK